MGGKAPNDEASEPWAEAELPTPAQPRRRRLVLLTVSGSLAFLMILSLGGFLGVLWSRHDVRAPGPLTAAEQYHRSARGRQIVKEARAKIKPGPVQKIVPASPTPPYSHNARSEHHAPSAVGELYSPIYGALPTSLNASIIPQPSLGIASMAATIAKIGPTMPAQLAKAGSKPTSEVKELAMDSPAKITVGPGIDALGISVRGVEDPRLAEAILDGPVDSGATHAAAAPPKVSDGAAAKAKAVSPTMVARAQDQEKALAARLAAATGEAFPAGDGGAKAREGAKPIHTPVIDASEGTPYDPLLDKTYDLNYPKTVPTSTAPP